MQEMGEQASLGRVLRAARESKGMSIEAVANALHISASTIKLIETDEYDLNAPDAVFMRGYIRSYARLVELSEDEVGDMFQSLGLVTKIQKAPKRDKIKIKQLSFKDKPIKLITNFIIIVLVILLLIWWYSHYVANNKPAQSPVVVTEQPINDTQVNVQSKTNVIKSTTENMPETNVIKPTENSTVTNAIKPAVHNPHNHIVSKIRPAVHNPITSKIKPWYNPDKISK